MEGLRERGPTAAPGSLGGEEQHRVKYVDFEWIVHQIMKILSLITHPLVVNSLDLRSMGTFQLHCCLWRVRKLSDFIKNSLICVPKMNENLMGLERHEGE